MSSCFLLAMQDDSIEGIFDTLKQMLIQGLDRSQHGLMQIRDRIVNPLYGKEYCDIDSDDEDIIRELRLDETAEEAFGSDFMAAPEDFGAWLKEKKKSWKMRRCGGDESAYEKLCYDIQNPPKPSKK